MHRLSLLLSVGLFLAAVANGQTAPEPLQSDKAVEKPLDARQVHTYTLNLQKDEFVQLAATQKGIDVVIRVFAPRGNLLKQFDGPTGSEGTDYAEIISDTAGTFRIEIAALEADDSSASGKYEIKIVEWRRATQEELLRQTNEGSRKAKALTLVVETAQTLDQFRVPQTRVAMYLMAAQMLWQSDEKKAKTLMAEAVETVKQLIAGNEDTEDDYERYQETMGLRQQILTALALHDPEAALKFLQSTRLASFQGEQEVQLESALINQVVIKDPKKAFELAEDLLQRNCSLTLIQSLRQLMPRDRDLAARLARDMARKLASKNFLAEPEAAYVSLSLIQAVRLPLPPARPDGENSKPTPLLADEEVRDLFLKLVSGLLDDRKSEEKENPSKHVIAQGLAAMISQMPEEIKTYAPNLTDEINKKIAELGGSVAQPAMDWQRYQSAAMKEPIDTALTSIEEAPAPMRDYLYQQVLTRIAATGDLSRARQLASARITNPSQRKQMLRTLQQQTITLAAQQGRIDEALQSLSKLPPAERIEMLNQIIDEIGPGVKKSEAIAYLERARNLISTSVRAENSDQMRALLAIARAFARHDINRAFQIVGPLIDQFNELCAAAVIMNGFSGEYYVEGEMTSGRVNELSGLTDLISDTLANLGRSDFDRARRSAEGISRFDSRARALLIIAGDALEVHFDAEQPEGGPN